MNTSPYVSKLIIKDKHRQIRHITDELRGKKKTVAKTSKALKNHYNGLMYWKNKYMELVSQGSLMLKLDQPYNYQFRKDEDGSVKVITTLR